MCWTDSLEIAISLADNFPEIDPKTINFVDLRELVLNLE
ncbi:Fe-S cluster assembly protein IscX, partial [Candidatus Pseudothioglobus singularis]